MIIAQQNGRTTIGAPDKLFGVSSRAKERIAQIGKENVIDSTIGVLLNDEGKLVVLDSVMEAIRALAPEDYAAYAPILGTPAYLESVKKAVFLDEMPEFSRRSLEILRQPLEDRNIHISRVNGNYEFPAGFILCAAMN